MITSRRFTELYFLGPARSVKTAALIENAIAHAITCNPRRVHLTHVNEAKARDYSVDKVQPMIDHCPDLARRQGTRRGDRNLLEKNFAGGMRLTIGAPTVAELSGKDVDLALATDVDRWPEAIGGEGCPIALNRKRIETAESQGMFVAESSPGRAIIDEAHKPDHPHGAPKCTGIVSYYDTGTRGRLYWHCLHCAEAFEPRFERFDFNEALEPMAAGEGAVMICPHCGGVMEYKDRAALNAGAVWLHQAADGGVCTIDGDLRPGSAVSYWLPAAAAVFQSWPRLISRYVAAKRNALTLSSDVELRTVVNTDLGIPYRPIGSDDETPLDADTLEARAQPGALAQAPAGTAFLVAAVDVQKNRFVVQIEAVDLDLARVIIDRFDINNPPPDAPDAGGRAIDPAKYPEDWRALDMLEGRHYPVQGGGYALRILRVGVDTGGQKGVTPKAYAHYRRRRSAGQGDRWRMMKGLGGFGKPMAEIRKPVRANAIKGRRGHAAHDVPILWAGTDELKDEIDLALRRTDPGVRSLRLAQGLVRDVALELVAERREPKGWVKRPGIQNNEALDLAVYCLAIVIDSGAERIVCARPPAWARPDLHNSLAVLEGATDEAADDVAPPSPAPRRARRRIVTKRR